MSYVLRTGRGKGLSACTKGRGNAGGVGMLSSKMACNMACMGEDMCCCQQCSPIGSSAPPLQEWQQCGASRHAWTHVRKRKCGLLRKHSLRVLLSLICGCTGSPGSFVVLCAACDVIGKCPEGGRAHFRRHSAHLSGASEAGPGGREPWRSMGLDAQLCNPMLRTKGPGVGHVHL